MDTTFAPQPHTEAADIIRGKPIVARSVFDQLLPELRGRVFTVSGVEAANVMQRVQDSIASIAEGETWDDAKGDIIAELDPFLGSGADRRAELLLRTHGFQAFQASNWRVAHEDDDTTHLQYLTMEDDRVRESHAALDGIILPKDDPFWQTHFPPWEWGCRCRTRTMNPDQVDEAKAADEDRAPDDKLVLEGPALRKLNEGQIVRNGQATSVLPPEGDNAFRFHPDDLRISLDELKSRYDDATWNTFETFAKAQKIDGDVTLFDWLSGAAEA
jgi:SPP1 gp7 family putative phage head morphogenesis protein